MKGVGAGYLIVNAEGTNFGYRGTVPDVEPDEQVVIMRMADLEKMVKAEASALLATKQEMPEHLFEQFPDGLTYDLGQYQAKLFLDRHLYSRNFKDELWVRFADVDQYLIEESPDET